MEYCGIFGVYGFGILGDWEGDFLVDLEGVRLDNSFYNFYILP